MKKVDNRNGIQFPSVLSEKQFVDDQKSSSAIQSNKLYKRILSRSFKPYQRTSWKDYIVSVGVVVSVTLFARPFAASLDHANLVMLYLFAEVVVATRLGLGPSILTAILSVVTFHFFFIVPFFTFTLDEAQYLLTFVGLLVIGLTISILSSRVREQVNSAQRREQQATVSYDFSQALAASVGIDAIIESTLFHIKRVFKERVVILLPGEAKLVSRNTNPGFELNDYDLQAADWTLTHGKQSGRKTANFSKTAIRFLPLKTAQGTLGVLGVKQMTSSELFTEEHYRLLETFANQAALAIERAQFADQARQAQLIRERETLQSALLNSISHDLRTPMASITGVLSSLHDDEAFLDRETRRELVANAWNQANRMNRLIANLLDMTRLQAGAMKATRAPCDIQDIIGVALAEMGNRLGSHSVALNIQPELPLISADFVLISRVLINLLDNARKYSKSGTEIEINVIAKGGKMEIEVSDRGSGIPPESLPRVFDKFFRAEQTGKTGGTGLGLSICKGIIEVHGGQISLQNRPGGGAIVRITLPLEYRG